MTVHVSVRSISALLSISVGLLAVPAGALAQSVVAPQKTAPTLAARLDRLAAEFDRNRIDLHGYIVSNETTGRAIYEVERVEVGVDLAPDTFTLQPSAAPGQAK